MEIRITQDTEAHATYIYVAKRAPVARTEELPNGVDLDFDADGNLLGIEVLELVTTLLLDDITNRRHQPAKPETEGET